MWSLLIAVAFAGPTVDVGVGGGVVGPPLAPGWGGPVLSGELAVGGLVEGLDALAVASTAEVGVLGCPGCGVDGTLRVGVGPMWRTRWLDAAAEGRLSWSRGYAQLRPAIALTGHIPAAKLDLQPWLVVEGVRGVDVGLGLRVGVPVGGTRTRRQCPEEDAWRFTEGGVAIPLSFEAPTADSPRVTVEPAAGRMLDDPASRQALGAMAGWISAGLSLKTAATAGYDVYTSEVGAATVAGVTGAHVGTAVDLDIPTSPEELPAAMASNMLRLGQRAVDGLMEVVDRHDGLLLDVTAEADIERVEFACRPIEVCVGGLWQDGGYWPDDVRRTKVRTVSHRVESISRQHELMQAMHRMETWWSRYPSPRTAKFESGEEPCAAAPGFGDAVQALEDAAEAQRRACDELRRRIAELESERRGLVGVSPALELDQREFEKEMAENECEYERESVADWEQSAGKQEELARLTGLPSATAAAERAREIAREHARRAEEQCQRASDLGRRIEELEDHLERAPGRVDEIDAELAGLREQLAECEGE